MRIIASVLCGMLIVGCGGSDKPARAPAPTDDEAAGTGGADTVLIPEEKFEEIKSVFSRKTSIVSRCYVKGVEAGEMDKATKGFVTVGVTISAAGTASSVAILKTSFPAAVSDCVKEMVAGWTFTDGLPRPVETSHTYVMDRF